MNVSIRKVGPCSLSKDETGWCVLYLLNGYIYLMDAGGFRGGYDDVTLDKLAKKAKEWSVNECVIEGNFGDGMFLKIFSPVLTKLHQCALVEVKSSGQKEVRIADVLEPVMGAHKLVVSDSAISNDYKTARNQDGTHDVKYSLFYQMTRLTRDRGALAHDDRLDALAIGVAYFVEAMSKNSETGADDLIEEWLEEQMNEDRIHSQLREVLVHNGDVDILIGGDDWDDFNGVGLCDWGR